MTFDDTPHSDDFYVSDQPRLLDVTWITNALLSTYFGSWRNHEIIAESIRNSHCFGLYQNAPHEPGMLRPRDSQVGFCRLVTDGATFSWLCDVVIGEPFRGRGLGKFLIGEALKHAKGAVYLGTRDTHSLYAKFGFTPVTVMRRVPGDKP